jgi:isoleucyl-tRNA synthetase
MPRVRPADRTYDPAALERAVQAQWGRTKAFERTQAAAKARTPFYFVDGPPYTSGHIHLGTAWNKVLKDSVVRWRRMAGWRVRSQAGYDMHGLPIEVKVEQELGIRDKRQIEALGVAAFVARCRKFSTDFLEVMNGEFQQLGVWLDWQKPYMTITNRYIEGAWWAFAQAHRRGLVYRAQRSIAWCPRCETALAAAELEYEEREDPSVYVKLPLEGRPGEHLVVWTTTPWTLPGNVAVAVHKDFGYAQVVAVKEGREETLWVVDAQVDNVLDAGRYDTYNVVATRAGRELEGWRYAHPFADEVPFHRDPGPKRNRVILGEHVTADKTGMVHTATGFGAEDFEVGERYGIGPFCPVDEAGRYTHDAGTFEGRAVKEAEQDILATLERKGLLLGKGTERHSYGHCWRCRTPILYRATLQWFLQVTKVRRKMLSEVGRVAWTPAWAGSARQRDWVAQARDWCVSRQRYWGIPIPIWQCSKGHVAVVGSAKELKQRARNHPEVLRRYQASLRSPGALPLNAFGALPRDELDLHRPWIDELVLRCRERGCGQDMQRTPDVFDVWYDSACSSWAQLGWPSDKKEYAKWFPCDWIVEGLDQTRGWFYSQLAAGVCGLGEVPYRSVLMHGFVHDEQGRPMSKSLGNIIPPAQVIEKHGADAFRLYVLSTCAPWEDVRFNWEGVRNAQRALNILWNVHVFATHAMAGLDPARAPAGKVAKALRPEDQWLRSRLAGLAEEVDAAFRASETHKAARALQSFVLDDLSRWYVRLVRDRLYGEPGPDKLSAQRTLHGALLATAKMLAPFCPHVTEVMYKDLGGSQLTVHMEAWPRAAEGQRKKPLERRMALARQVVDAAMAARDKGQLKLRLPVPRLTVAGGKDVQQAVRQLQGLVAEVANAKQVELAGEHWEGLVWQVVPDRTRIGPAFKGQAPKVMEALKAAQADALRDALLQGPYRLAVEGQAVEITPEMVRFQATLPEGVVGADFPGGSVYLDTHIPPALQAEGLAREVVRRIQEMRKEAKLERGQAIRTELGLDPARAELLAPWLDRIQAQTRSRSLALVEKPGGRHVRDWDIEGERVVIGIA